MIKLISPYDWDFGFAPAALVKRASTGLRGGDRAAFLQRADHVFLPYLEKIAQLLKPGEVPVHLIALGATEKIGANRNGDGFTCATCRTRHHTFEKLARFYRDHRNKDAHLSYGRVVKSAFNEAMGRVELLGALNGTKEAADANGGLVADLELEALEKEGDFTDSMSCRIKHDVCSYCGNASRTRAEYCTPATCKAGGCRDNLGRVVKVGGKIHHLHVDNPADGLDWFDISHITTRKQADRTALGTTAEWLQKAAAIGGPAATGGAALAEAAGVSGPWTPALIGMSKLAAGLAALAPWQDEVLWQAAAFDTRLNLNRRDPRLNEKLAALADCGVFLSPADFARTFGPIAGPGYAELVERLPDYADQTAFAAANPGPAEVDYARTKHASALIPSACARRAAVAVIRGATSVEERPDAARGPYAAYKLAALWRYAGADSANFGLTARAARAQDR